MMTLLLLLLLWLLLLLPPAAVWRFGASGNALVSANAVLYIGPGYYWDGWHVLSILIQPTGQTQPGHPSVGRRNKCCRLPRPPPGEKTATSGRLCLFDHAYFIESWPWPSLTFEHVASQCHQFHVYMLTINSDQFHLNISIHSGDIKWTVGQAHSHTRARTYSPNT